MKILVLLLISSLLPLQSALAGVAKNKNIILFDKKIEINEKSLQQIKAHLGTLKVKDETFKIILECDRKKAFAKDHRADPLNCYATRVERKLKH